MQSSDVQKDIPAMVEVARLLLADLENAANSGKKADICEYIRSAMRCSETLKSATSKALTRAQKCSK